jgi:hypothetical protein
MSSLEAGDSISLSDEVQVIAVLRESVQGLWEVVNNLTRLRPTKRQQLFSVLAWVSHNARSDEALRKCQ